MYRDGIVDLSVGTPVDPVPESIQKTLGLASNSPGYPLTGGTEELRTAISNWCRTRLAARGEFEVLPTIGSKELVAWLPTLLGSRRVLFPEIAYPHLLGWNVDCWSRGNSSWRRPECLAFSGFGVA